MKKSGIFFVALYVIAAAAVLYFGYTVVRERYFAPDGLDVSTQKNEESQPAAGQSADETPASLGGGDSAGENQSPGESHLYVASEDCDNNCKKFKDNSESLKYCQQVCGIAPVQKKNSEEECASFAGLEKDYCWRDLAVSKKDFEICNKISDAKLKTVCRNRVTEEVLN